MPNYIKLTKEQVFFLAFIGIIGNMVYCHTYIDNDADRSAWVAAFVGIILIIPFAIWILYLGKSYPNKTIFDILEIGVGKFISRFISVIFILINFSIVIVQLNMFTQMLKTFFLQYTPSLIIMLVLVFISMIFVRSGLLILARLIEVLCALSLFNYISTFIFAFPKQFHLEYIIPIFDTTFLGFIKSSAFLTGNACEFLLLLMVLIRFIPEPVKHYKWVVSGIVVSSIIFSFAIMLIIGMLSPELAKRIAFGGVNASILIQIGEYVRGLEIFVFGTYQFITIGKISVCLLCVWECSKKIFNNWKPNIQLYLLSLLILIPSVWLDSYSKAYFLSVFLANYILLPFSILSLLLTTFAIMIKNKRTGSG